MNSLGHRLEASFYGPVRHPTPYRVVVSVGHWVFCPTSPDIARQDLGWHQKPKSCANFFGFSVRHAPDTCPTWQFGRAHSKTRPTSNVGQICHRSKLRSLPSIANSRRDQTRAKAPSQRHDRFLTPVKSSKTGFGRAAVLLRGVPGSCRRRECTGSHRSRRRQPTHARKLGLA